MPLTQPLKDGLYFLPLGGTNDIGMNFSLYACSHQWIAVDLGMGFGKLPWQEVLLPDPSSIVSYRQHLKGLLITHAHEDHLGGIPYIWPHLRCPIYATAFSMHLIREKLEEFDFIDEVPLIEVGLNASVKLGVFDVQFISVTHSVPEASILSIKTPKGTVVHTGDWRLDPTPPVGAETDIASLRALGDAGVRALVCDSTNIFKEAASASESYIKEQLEHLVGQYPDGNIVITCFASNVARLESCALAAAVHGRKPVLIGRSLKRIERIARASGYFKDIPSFLEEKAVHNLLAQQVLYICTGSQGEGRSALHRIAANTHLNVHLQSEDIVIFSSREIPGNERAIAEMQNKLARRGIRSLTVKNYDVHVSGHPSKEELQKLYAWLRPELVVPIHGGARQLLEHADFARSQGISNVLIPHDGLLLRLDAEQAQSVEEVATRQLVVDGNILLPLQGKAQQERLKGAIDGIVFVTLSQKGKSGITLELSSYGLFEEAESAQEKRIFEEVYEYFFTIHKKAEESSQKKRQDFQKSVKAAVHKIFLRERGKKPQVVLHIL
ncbi:MAG: ribonuclease J [Holosporales bacterium]|jgi:ribonuclease J|nr:ribonuclease J [Holosporales bacterium]